MKVVLTICVIYFGYISKGVTDKVDGGWGEWTSWSSCSMTCTIGFRTRTRKCDNPKPSFRGKDCKGDDKERETCDTRMGCPIDGSWSRWSSWECSVSCGGGTGKRQRKCSNPEPLYGGKDCVGNNLQLGKCNTKICPDQLYTLSPETQKMVEDNLKNFYNNTVIQEGESTVIPCNQTVVKKMYEEYPDATVQWRKNNKLLNLAGERILLNVVQLTIQSAIVEDTGVYACLVAFASCCIRIASISVLTVQSEKRPTIAFENEMLILNCNYLVLIDAYNNLTRTWLHNNIKKNGLSTTNVTVTTIIDRAEFKDTGVWKCQVTDEKTQRTWIINIIHVKVLPQKHWLTKWFINKYVLYSMLGILVVCISIFLQVLIYLLKTTESTIQNEYRNIRDILHLEVFIGNKSQKDIILKIKGTPPDKY